MARKARIENGVVAEILDTGKKKFPPFHSSLTWVTCNTTVKEGWLYDGTVFTSPPPPPAPTQKEIDRKARRLRIKGYKTSGGGTTVAALKAAIKDIAEELAG